MPRRPPTPPLLPYTTLFRSGRAADRDRRPRNPLHELFRPPDARLLEGRLRPAQADGDHAARVKAGLRVVERPEDRKSTRLNSSHRCISYAVFCLKKKTEHRKLNFLSLLSQGWLELRLERVNIVHDLEGVNNEWRVAKLGFFLNDSTSKSRYSSPN